MKTRLMQKTENVLTKLQQKEASSCNKLIKSMNGIYQDRIRFNQFYKCMKLTQICVDFKEAPSDHHIKMVNGISQKV